MLHVLASIDNEEREKSEENLNPINNILPTISSMTNSEPTTISFRPSNHNTSTKLYNTDDSNNNIIQNTDIITTANTNEIFPSITTTTFTLAKDNFPSTAIHTTILTNSSSPACFTCECSLELRDQEHQQQPPPSPHQPETFILTAVPSSSTPLEEEHVHHDSRRSNNNKETSIRFDESCSCSNMMINAHALEPVGTSTKKYKTDVQHPTSKALDHVGNNGSSSCSSSENQDVKSTVVMETNQQAGNNELHLEADDVETLDGDDESSFVMSFSNNNKQHSMMMFSQNFNNNSCSTFSLIGDEMSIIEVSSPTETTPSRPSFDLSSYHISIPCVITKLDDDTIGVILSYCSIPEFESLSCTCRSFYNKFHLSFIYRQVFKRLKSSCTKTKSSRHYKSNHLQITPYLREVLRNTYHPTIFVPIRCMQFNAYTRFKDAIIDYWVKEYGFKRLNDAEVEINIDFSKKNPWIDHLENIVERNETDQRSTAIPRTISQLEILKNDQPFLKPILSERKSNNKISPFSRKTSETSSGNVLSDLLKTIMELKQTGSILKQQPVSNKFTDPNELDTTDSQRSGLNSAKSLIVANHWRVFDKFTLHIDFQFPSHERHFSFVEMPEITLYYHNFRTVDGNPRKDLIEISSGSIFKDGVDGKVYEFDSMAETNSVDGESPLNGKPGKSSFNKAASYSSPSTSNNKKDKTATTLIDPSSKQKSPKFTQVNSINTPSNASHSTNPFIAPNSTPTITPKKKSRFSFKKTNQVTTTVALPEERKRMKGALMLEANKFAYEEEKFEYDPTKVGKVLLYFIFHDFCPRFFNDYFSPKLAAIESKAQQTKLQYLMKYHEKEDPNVVIDYLTINRNQLKQYRSKMIRKHTSREARRYMVKDNCMSMVRNFAKLVPYINYDQMTIEQKSFLLKTMVLNHINPQDFLSMSDQLFMSSSFFGELRFNPTISSPFQINTTARKCLARDDPRSVWDYMINDLESLDEYSHSSLMSSADEVEYDAFQIYFDTMYTDHNSSAFSITGLDMPPINSEKIVVQRHILEIPTKFMMRCVTYHTPKNNARNEPVGTNTSSRSLSSMFKSFCGVFSLCYGKEASV